MPSLKGGEKWSAQIGTGKNRRIRTFSIKKYGNEEAKQMAIKTRKEWEQEYTT